MTFPFPFVPPTGIGGNDTYTKLLIHADGVDGSTAFTDASASGRTVTANGSAQVDTAQSVFGGASCFLTAATSDYLACADHADWAMGTTSWTVDFRFRASSLPTDFGFFAQTVDNNNRMFLAKNGSAIAFQINSGGSVIAGYTAAHGFSTGAWYHIEVSWDGSTFRIFKDGVAYSLSVNTAYTSWPDFAATFDIGRGWLNSAQRHLDGWIDEFRVSRGIARHTSNFTPPNRSYG